VFLINSRNGLVTAAHLRGRTFSRSYGTILPSSFTRVLSSALEFSSCLPVSVYGTVPRDLKLRGFSWKRDIGDFVQMDSSLTSMLTCRICLTDPPQSSPRDNQRPVHLTFSVPPSQSREVLEY
jgi:hypothetical protein